MSHIPRSKKYAAVWRVVHGSVRDAFNSHPDYLTEKGRRVAVDSVTKRVVGNILGFVEEATEGHSPVADNAQFQHLNGKARLAQNNLGWMAGSGKRPRHTFHNPNGD